MADTPPDIQKVLADPNFMKLSGADQVAVLKHMHENAPAPEQSKATMQFTYPAAGPGAMPFTTQVTPEEHQRLTEEYRQARTDAGKQTLVAGATMIAPELLPEMAGGGFLGFLGRLFARSGSQAVGAATGKMAGDAASGDNPFSTQQLKDTAKLAAWTGALALPLEAIGGAPRTNTGMGAINKSMGTVGRDMEYANPARALAREDIADIGNGDWNAYQLAKRAGKTPNEMAQAAGGRFAAVSQRINELTPRLGNLLNQSTAQIPVKNVIDIPLEDAAIDIIKNGALGDTEKMAALTKLGELQQSMKQGLGPTATPAQLQVLKQQIGDRVNWGGNSAVTDDVKGAFKNLYGSLKEAIHTSVPGSAEIDDRLTDLLGASDVLKTAAKGQAGGNLPFTAVRATQSGIGHVLPAAAKVAPAAIPVGATIGQQLQSKQAQPNSPTLPFHPGAGIPKP